MKTIDFICIGAQKAASTWLDIILREHPGIQTPKNKELIFFTNHAEYGDKNPAYVNFGKPLSWYLDQFTDDKRIKGEVSTHYITDAKAARRIKKAFPNIKIIAILRNPISRAYSHYVMERYDRVTESRSLKKIFDEDKKNEILTRGLYAKQLKPYFKEFSKDQLKIILVDDIKNSPEKVVSDIYSFLGVNKKFKPSVISQRVNKSTRAKIPFIKKSLTSLRRVFEENGLKKIVSLSNKIGITKFILHVENKYNRVESEKKPLDKELKSALQEYYKKDILNLEKLLERDLGFWLANENK